MALEAATFLEETFNRSSNFRWNEMYTYDTSNLVLDFDDGVSMEFVNMEENAISGNRKGDKVINVDKMKRRCARKSCKNKEEVENQRMTHIMVERNRRKLMNEHLAVLHSLMPPEYVPRGDQASIVGGAVNFIKDLEQQIHTFVAIKRMKQMQEFYPSTPIPDTFSQRKSVCSSNMNTTNIANASNSDAVKTLNRKGSSVANIDVSMADSHVTLKILTQKLPKQLYKIAARLQNLQFTVLHLTVCTTGDEMAFYSFSLKVEDDCQFRSADDITIVVTRMVEEIAKEAGYN